MALYTPEYKPNGREVAVIKTSKGDIRVQLAGEDAPIHVGNFVELARKGFYDNLKFHRYVPGFVIQGGCPNTRDLDPEQVKAAAGNPWAGLGAGGPGYTIKQEYTTNPHNSHDDGALAMARSQMPDSAGSQFYLCLGPQHGLDSGYTVFGQTIEGKDVIAQLRVGDVIETIVIENAD
jgi:peptidyl-prolyl cis-trans isomerase B (cyclophilin B)